MKNASRNAFSVQTQWNPVLFTVYLSKKLAFKKFICFKESVAQLASAKQSGGKSSLLHRFTSDTVFTYGAANIQPSKFRGVASSPNQQVKKILAKNYIVINTPEHYTSQRCCLCGHQIEQQKAIISHKQNVASYQIAT